MSVFEQVPYTNYHDLNLDWILNAIVKQNQTISEFVTGNVLTYANPIQWDINTQYAKNTVVVGPDGTAYMSIAPVSIGVTLDDTSHWLPIFNYKQIVNDLESQIASNEGAGTAATKAYKKGALIWSNDKLYRAIIDIPNGTIFNNSNVVQITVEQAIVDSVGDILKRTAVTISDSANETVSRTAKNIVDTASGDYTETCGHKTVEAEQITEHMTADREIDVDGNNSIHIDGANTLNVGGTHTEVYSDTFGKTVNKASTEIFNDTASETFKARHIINGVDCSETYTGSKSVTVGIDRFIVRGKTKSVDLLNLPDSFFDITAHGAKENSDCTDIIMAGLSSGKPVYIPAGKWQYTTINMKAGDVIFGAGYGANTAGTLLINIGGNSIVADGRDITIQSLTLERLNSAGGTVPDGITVKKNCQFMEIDRVSVVGFTNGIHCYSQSWMNISNTYAENNTKAGFFFENADSESGEPMQVNLLNCLAQVNKGGGFNFINNNKYDMSCGTMINCATFGNTGNGVTFAKTGAGGIAAIRIANCFFGNDSATGITIANGTYPATISNTQIELSGTSGIVITASKSVLLSNCMLHRNNKFGVYAGEDSEISISNCEFFENCFNGSAEGDLFVGYAKAIVNGNIFHSNTTALNTNELARGIITNNYFMNYTTAIKNTTMISKNNIDKNGAVIA